MGVDTASFKNLYISTAKENIAYLKKDLPEVLKDINNKALIEEIYRKAHTLKSESMVMGYANIGTMCGAIENAFFDIQHDKKQLSKELIEALIGIISKLEECISSIDKNNTEYDFSLQLKQLQNITV